MQTIRSFRSFNRPVQVALANMLANNVGFYMLVPFLAGYMAHDLGLSLWVVGLVLGIRVLSQQGMSLLGGSLGDWIGYKRAIVAGSVLRTVAFALFGFADGPIGMTAAAILTGLGGALLSPAVRAYISQEAGPRRVEAFALLDVTMHGGSLLGPIVGSLLIGIDFRLVCLGAAVMFALVTFLQLQFLPPRHAETGGSASTVIRSWGEPLRNRPFVFFALSVLGYLFLYNQIYLGLPLEVERLTGSSASVGVLFTLLAVVGILGQVPMTTAARARLRPPTAMAAGVLMMGLAFVPLLATAGVLPVERALVAGWLAAGDWPTPPLLVDSLTYCVNFAPMAVCCLVLVSGQMLLSPFVSDAIAALSRGRLVGTYFGIYAVVQGVGAALGNLAGGAAFDFGRVTGYSGVPWLLMIGVGVACAAGLVALDRTGQLAHHTADQGPARAKPTLAGATTRH